ncbi:CubicO group peptidase, beta-lactamase class C family [Poseidonocella pacifica]|uniref:CubicO group peptidase, beta-lactamase class C family n=2 Tax=Poseidonocella pacifica TaxID=871651 RepID=A0A1I0W868_9RHOB|nr:CubicO group peptidase, beta-lactamase class C family [Poseidonocella pacifica]
MLSLLALSSAAMSAQADNLDLGAIEDHITRTLERDRVPGAAVAIVRRTDVLFLRGFGNDGQGRPVQKDTGFVIGSMSKAFTALTAMRLIEAGRVALDTPIVPTLPELENADSVAWQNITLGHLLTHTSGVPTRTPDMPPDTSLAQHVEALSDVELNGTHAARHAYSSANYILAARMLEMVSGTPFDLLLADQVLAPLGIVRGDRPLTERRPRGHQYWFVWPRSTDRPAEIGRLATSAMTASVADMARFLQFQLGDGTWNGQSLLSAAGLAEMHKGTAQGDGFSYGLGWRNVDIVGVRKVQHGGVVPDFRGKMILLPDHDAAVVVLTNASSVLPLPIRPTSHRLANEIAIHLAGGPLRLPNLGYRTWLILIWSALGIMVMHQFVTLARVALGRDPARHPLRSAAIDTAMVLGILFVLPWGLGLSLRALVDQTPDLALWLATMSLLAICVTAIRAVQARSTGSRQA